MKLQRFTREDAMPNEQKTLRAENPQAGGRYVARCGGLGVLSVRPVTRTLFSSPS